MSVDIIDGDLMGRSNISVDCLTKLDFAEGRKAFGRFVRVSIDKGEGYVDPCWKHECGLPRSSRYVVTRVRTYLFIC